MSNSLRKWRRSPRLGCPTGFWACVRTTWTPRVERSNPNSARWARTCGRRVSASPTWTAYAAPCSPDSPTPGNLLPQLEIGLLGRGQVGDLGPLRGDVFDRRRLVEVGAVILEQRDALHLTATDHENRCVIGVFLGAQVGHHWGDILG